MSLTYFVLNLLLQNEMEPPKMESDSYDKVIKSLRLMQLECLKIQIDVEKIDHVSWKVVNALRNVISDG